MQNPSELLAANHEWVQKKLSVSPKFFEDLSHDQQPEFLWIGCSDSRVPAEEVTGASPGQLFVHRNVANLVIHTDFNMLAVLQYAVEVLKVRHIIVCGHYGCGGVMNAMSNKDLGLINKWLRHIKDVYRLHQHELDRLITSTGKYDRLVELNVIEQVKHVVETSIIQKSWATIGLPEVHGWVYDMRTGLLKELVNYDRNSHIEPIFRYDID
ncbi:MAG: carbonic anhydrase [Armatimonadota bacterium]